MKYLITFFAMFTICFSVKAEGNIMFEQANALYHSKNYDSAARLYTQLVQNGYCSDDLYYNMGNAFYKSGKTGWAIWSYKKSMIIRCSKNALDNYRLAKKQIKNPLLEQDEIFFLKWWRGLYSLFTVNGWSIVALISFVIFLLSMFLRLVKKKRFTPLLGYIFLFVFVASILLMMIQYHISVNHYDAVLVESALFQTKDSQYNERLPEGSEISMLNSEPKGREGQVMVKLSDLREGYIPKETIKRL